MGPLAGPMSISAGAMVIAISNWWSSCFSSWVVIFVLPQAREKETRLSTFHFTRVVRHSVASRHVALWRLETLESSVLHMSATTLKPTTLPKFYNSVNWICGSIPVVDFDCTTQHNQYTMASDRKWAQMLPDVLLMVATVRTTLVPLRCASGLVGYNAHDRY